MTITKEELTKRINKISEDAKNYEDIGIIIINKCESLQKKLNSIKDEDAVKLEEKLMLFKFELDRVDIILLDHITGKNLAYGRLTSKFSLNFTYALILICIVMYSTMFVAVDSFVGDNPIDNMMTNLYTYLKYFLISVMGALLYFLTDSIALFSKSVMRLLVAMLIPVLFVGILFKTGNSQPHTLDLTSSNILLFLFGYSSNIITMILNKAITKLEEVFNAK